MKFLKTYGRLLTYFLVVLMPAGVLRSQANVDPFAFFQPSVTITADERAKLAGGSPIARVLQAQGSEIALLAAVPVNADGDRLVAWMRRIEEFKKNPDVLAIRRFSDPPRIEDLNGLELDGDDLAAIQSCQPGKCDLKLSAGEMTELQQQTGGSEGVQQAFRRLVLKRVQEYLSSGQIPPNEDHHKEVLPESRFESLLQNTPFLSDHLPQIVEGLREKPMKSTPEVESFLYWSKEHLGRKAMISVTQVVIVRGNEENGLPDAVAVGKDVFATHYIDASLSVTALIRDDAARRNYLVYLNRTDVDVLHGVFRGTIRWEIDRRLKDASRVLEVTRQRLESGPPPESDSSKSQ